jgi:hypothetical protein
MLSSVMRFRRDITTSIAFGLALAIAAFVTTGCGGSTPESRAREHAAARLGVDADDLRITQRGELATPRHVVLRATAGSGAELTVAVARQGSLIVDGRMHDAFARLAQAERAGARFDELGAERIAGWFGAFAGGVCGEPLAESRGSLVKNEVLPDAHRLSWSYAGDARVMRCTMVLGNDGRVRDAVSEAQPIAAR